jgi:hypothetical protein
MEKHMKKVAAVLLMYAVLVSLMPGAALAQQQPGKQSAAQKLEALLNAADIPFNKPEEGNYYAVISVSQNESEKFHIHLSYLGDDANNEQYQLIQMYFLLGQIPKGASFPPALIKQINVWNANLTVGRVIAVGTVVLYVSNSWLAHTDADSLVQDAALGHYVSEDLRKEIAPYLKQ